MNINIFLLHRTSTRLIYYMGLKCLSLQSSFTTTMYISNVFVHVFFVALLVSSITAAPVVKGLSSDVVQLSARENHMKTAVRIVRQIRRSLIAIPNKSVFYTGHKPGKKGPFLLNKRRNILPKPTRRSSSLAMLWRRRRLEYHQKIRTCMQIGCGKLHQRCTQ